MEINVSLFHAITVVTGQSIILVLDTVTHTHDTTPTYLLAIKQISIHIFFHVLPKECCVSVSVPAYQPLRGLSH